MTTTLQADEGMWLLNDPPKQMLKKKYDFDLTDAWLGRAKLASVRFNSGGSGGFVSPEGLIVTNHHIGAGCLQKLSAKKRDLLKTGIHAKARKDEQYQSKVDEAERQAYSTIADVRFQVFGGNVAPDATFTLRLAFGVVRGYKEEGNENADAFTATHKALPSPRQRLRPAG